MEDASVNEQSYIELQQKVQAIVFNVYHNGTLPVVATKLIMDAVEHYRESLADMH